MRHAFFRISFMRRTQHVESVCRQSFGWIFWCNLLLLSLKFLDIYGHSSQLNTQKHGKTGSVFVSSPTCTFLPRQGCFTVIHPFPLLRSTPGSAAFLTTRNFISGAVCWDELRAAKDRGSILVTSDIKDTYERDTGGGEWWLTHSELRYKAAVSRLGDVFIAGQLLCHL